MDEEVKRFIESALDETIEKGELLEVLRIHMKPLGITSFKEFALGYTIGTLKCLATSLLSAREIYTGKMRHMINEDKLEIDGMIRRRYHAIMERVVREQNK